MKVQRLRALVMLALVWSALVFWSDDAFAQRRRLRIPGRTGVKSRPVESPSEKKEDGDGGSQAAVANDPLGRSQLTVELGAETSTLRSEFTAAQSIYDKLKPEQFIAARLLTQYARGSGMEVSSQDLFRGLANKKSYRTTLKTKGLTDDQVNQLMQRLRVKMRELL